MHEHTYESQSLSLWQPQAEAGSVRARHRTCDATRLKAVAMTARPCKITDDMAQQVQPADHAFSHYPFIISHSLLNVVTTFAWQAAATQTRHSAAAKATWMSPTL